MARFPTALMQRARKARIGTACDASHATQHILCWDNCHSHVACCLNAMRFAGMRWNMVSVAMLMFFRGRFVR